MACTRLTTTADNPPRLQLKTPHPLDAATIASSADIRFELLGEQYLALVAQWFGRPHVAQWWDDPQPDRVEPAFFAGIDQADGIGIKDRQMSE